MWTQRQRPEPVPGSSLDGPACWLLVAGPLQEPGRAPERPGGQPSRTWPPSLGGPHPAALDLSRASDAVAARGGAHSRVHKSAARARAPGPGGAWRIRDRARAAGGGRCARAGALEITGSSRETRPKQPTRHSILSSWTPTLRRPRGVATQSRAAGISTPKFSAMHMCTHGPALLACPPPPCGLTRSPGGLEADRGLGTRLRPARLRRHARLFRAQVARWARRPLAHGRRTLPARWRRRR